MCTTSQMRGHHDHSHDEHNHDHNHDHDHGHHHHHGLLGHHHHHDNVYLTSSNKHDAGVRITRIGLYSNLGMAIAKGAGGYIFNSQSMIADAWHSLTDLASDILTLATVSWSLRPPTKNFPLGFGKVESLGSLGVSSMLLFGGIFMCISSCQSLYAHWFLDTEAAAALLEHAMKVARERKSSVLASNAVHHRVDSLTGIVALIAILGANLIHDATWLDPVGGLFISLLVIRAGVGNTLSALYELADRSIDDEVRDSIAKQVGKALLNPTPVNSGEKMAFQGEQVELREITGVKSGQNYLVDVELAVPALWTVEEVRAVEQAVRARVGTKVRGVRKLRVRFVPKGVESYGGRDEFIPVRDTPEPEGEGSDDEHHHHEHVHKKGSKGE
ncbi:putative metal transporter protein [Thermochaetoides thermophila DSM 1495]|uniref:Putative metal transporter protein n=1 Tax=Chaetomium thermophilum (strain DSM 1495 / CBS 144.50 / IMI 039719) TaxID=759272 RepID=G0SHM0_CHATD|nr:putative metal transporter protein [Thermochaetoides thermophila DSM 1495]EGS17709.1 putative metal transporter protein [Thermochaetoides thermophila DSM 1495]